MDIIVSTDSLRYKNIALNSGAKVPFIRPKELSLDLITDYQVCFHALIECQKIYNVEYHYIVWLRPTSPIRPPNLINIGIELLEKNTELESVRTVSVSKQHPLRQFYIKNNKLKTLTESKLKEPFNQPRQVFPTAYFQTGHMEVIRTSVIKSGSISGSSIAPIIVDNKFMFDLDTHDDLEYLLFKLKNNTELLKFLNN